MQATAARFMQRINSPIYHNLFFKKERIDLNSMFTTRVIWFFSLQFFAFGAFAQLDSAAAGYTRFYYENGVISSEGVLSNGIPDQFWQTYYENGLLKTAGNRSNGVIDGEWRFFRVDGSPERTINYELGKRTGIETEYSASGNLIAEIPWDNDVRSGTGRYFYETGELYRTVNFVNNKEEGKGFEYAQDQRIITFLSYQDGFLRSIEKVNRLNTSGQKTGYWVEFYPNGQIKEEGYFTNGVRNGIFKFFNKKGDLDRIEQYRADELVTDSEASIMLDIRKEFYADGTLKLVGSYREGSRQGVFREFDKEGTIVNSFIYENNVKLGEGVVDAEGREQGMWKLFFASGELQAEGEFIDGQRTGQWKFYFFDGKLGQKGTYRDGLPNGQWTWYYANGDVKRDEGYRRGKEDGEFVEYDAQGNLIHKGAFIDGYKNGPWFYHVNDHKEEGEYIDGEKTGEWMYTYDNGKKYFAGEYLNGVPIGRHRWYYYGGQVKLEGKHTGGERDGDWKFYNEDGTVQVVVKYKNGEQVKIDGAKLPVELEN